MSQGKQVPISTGQEVYDVALEALISHFDKNAFKSLAREQAHHQRELTVMRFADNTSIKVTFPGIKSEHLSKFNRYRYDFRVDLCDAKGAPHSLSHAEIILDLFTKVSVKQFSYPEARSFLLGVREGKIPEPRPYTPRRIPQDYIDVYVKAHKRLKKSPQTPDRYDVPPYKLASLLLFILLQEEVNYPSYVDGKRTSFSGKTLPLDRYIEAVWAAAHAPHKLEDVFVRALTEGARPTRWKEVVYDLAQSSRSGTQSRV